MIGAEKWIHFILTEVYAAALLAFVFRRPLKEKGKDPPLRILLVMLALYLGALFYALLSPVYFYRRFAFSAERLNPVPFRALKEWLAHPFNFFGNVLLFMPLGFFEVLLHPGRSRKWQVGYSAATAALLSVLVEFAQMFNFRVPDVDDVILNTLGGTFGALTCILQQKAGFDRTRAGRLLLPRIPRSWHRHMLLNRFCVILVVTMEAALFTVNWIVTVPRPVVRENAAAHSQAAAPSPAPEAAAESAAVPTPVPRVYDTSDVALEARNVLLVRLGDGPEDDVTVFAVDSDSLIYPASTLKMLTALTVLDIARPEETVKLGAEIYFPPLDASRAGLEYGMTLSVEDLLKGLLLPSGADAAYALGVFCGRRLEGNGELSSERAVKAFVAAMNRKAEEIGARHTTAVNVVGLDAAGQRTTAGDILKIARVFLADPLLSQICALPSASISGGNGRTVSLSNTNKMLHANSAYYNENVAGVKTGTTSRAGNCLVSVFTAGGDRYLCVVMNSSYYGKFTDTQRLYEMCAEAAEGF